MESEVHVTPPGGARLAFHLELGAVESCHYFPGFRGVHVAFCTVTCSARRWSIPTETQPRFVLADFSVILHIGHETRRVLHGFMWIICIGLSAVWFLSGKPNGCARGRRYADYWTQSVLTTGLSFSASNYGLYYLCTFTASIEIYIFFLNFIVNDEKRSIKMYIE